MLLKPLLLVSGAGSYLPVLFAAQESIGVTEFGLGAVVVWIVVKEVFAYLKSRDVTDKRRLPKTDKHSVEFAYLTEYARVTGEQISTIKAKVDALFEWHSVKDPDGAPIWYIGHSLTAAVEKMVTFTGELVELQRELKRDFNAMSDRQARMETTLGEVKNSLPKRRAAKTDGT